MVTQRPPIIDPDVIGPDDFRAPTPKLTAADLDRAFDIWLKRRAFINKILKRLKEDRESKGLTEILQQVFGKPLPDLGGLLLIITKGDSSHDIENARDTVMTLGLSVESFIRLMSIRAKYRLAQSDARNEKVNQEE